MIHTFLWLRLSSLLARSPPAAADAAVGWLGRLGSPSSGARWSLSREDSAPDCGCGCGCASYLCCFSPASGGLQSLWAVAARTARLLSHGGVWSCVDGAHRGGGDDATTCVYADVVAGCWSRGRSSRGWTVGFRGRRRLGAVGVSSPSACRCCPCRHCCARGLL